MLKLIYLALKKCFSRTFLTVVALALGHNYYDVMHHLIKKLSWSSGNT